MSLLFWFILKKIYCCVRKRPFRFKKQWASCKSVLDILITILHMANSGWLSNEDQTLAHFRDHFTSTIIYETWVHLKNELLKPHVAGFGSLPHFGPF